ncbi:MAG TPA: threo-3-hydroxy-L-aspartate ammonia-lyase [Burkholderiaceae bacterium]|nr:threo-3-hydroxy-L-aspartate ammonia-lyase [Burkholderiaceae bacterium]
MNAADLPRTSLPVSFADLEAAQARLDGVAHRTPVVTSRAFNERAGAQVFFKCENLQRMGAFKFRGAYNALAQFTDAQRATGVIAFSSGNHAQATALSAKLLGMPAVIVMPKDAPAVKIQATREYGAEVVLYDRYREDREAIGQRIARERGMTLIPPYDHPHVMAGQGTAALELLREVGPLDVLFVCVGGGGMIAGSAIAAQTLSPRCRVIGVEPAAGDDARQSLESGARVKIDVPQTIADGAQTQQIGVLTFEVMQRLVDRIVTVTDEQLIATMRFIVERMKLVVEPTGCLGAAAALHRAAPIDGQRVGVILSGGNIDPVRFGQLLARTN